MYTIKENIEKKINNLNNYVFHRGTQYYCTSTKEKILWAIKKCNGNQGFQ